MVKIRLTRLGRHKLPFYRIVAVDARKKRDGAYIKLLGTYEPLKYVVKLDKQAALAFLKQGAIPTDTVKSFLKKEGVWKEFIMWKDGLKKLHHQKKALSATNKPSALKQS